MKNKILNLTGVKQLTRVEQKTITGARRLPPSPPGLNPCIWVKCGPTTHCELGVCVSN